MMKSDTQSSYSNDSKGGSIFIENELMILLKEVWVYFRNFLSWFLAFPNL